MPACASADSPLVEVFGWVGCCAAWLLFLSPLPTMSKIRRRGHIGDFSALPYLVSTLQCGMWAVYALPMVTPCKTQPLVTNAVGFVLELCCACPPRLGFFYVRVSCMRARLARVRRAFAWRVESGGLAYNHTLLHLCHRAVELRGGLRAGPAASCAPLAEGLADAHAAQLDGAVAQVK